MKNNINNTPIIRPDTIAKLSFVIFLFFAFFGTSLPFRETTEIETTTSNPVNQIVLSTVLFLSIISLFSKREQLVSLIKKEKFLTLFLLWCLLTIIWSPYSFLSFKRLIQIFATVAACLAMLLHTDSSKNSLKYFEWILYPYLVISLLSVFLVSGALDPNFGTWRALTSTKNNLGQVGLVGILISAVALKQEFFWKKLLAAIMFVISFALLFGSQSMTSIVTTGFISMIVIFLLIVKFVFPTPLIGRFIVTMIVISILFAIGSFIVVTPDVFLDLPQYIGRNATFTGRTGIWTLIIDEINKHPLIGCGFSSFWIAESDFITFFQQQFFWIPNQAHNGYLDIMNETGLIGFALVIMMIIQYMFHILKIDTQNLWKWFVIAALIINILESTLFRPRHLTGILFIFAYLALYSDNIRFRQK